MSNTFNVSRSIWTDPQFPNEPFTKREAWLWLISEASWKDRDYRIGNHVVSLKRGQLAASHRGLAQIWRWEKTKVIRFLELLTQDKNIAADTAPGVTVITICNYESYQSAPKSIAPANAPETHQHRTTSAPIQTTEVIPEVTSDVDRPRKRSRRTRLPENWEPSSKEVEYARKKGLSDDNIRTEAERFRNHWIGKGELRADWSRSWYNWVTSPYRKSSEPAGNRRQVGYRTNGDKFADAVAELRGEIAAAENGQDDWNNPGASHTGAVIDLESVRGGSEGRGQADSGRSNQHGHGTDWALPGFRSS